MSKRNHKQSMTRLQSSHKPLSLVQTLCDVVVLFHDGFSFLKPTLDAIQPAMGKYYQKSKVLLVDNFSDKGKLQEFQSNIPTDFSMIHTKEYLGFPAGCNLGINRGVSKYIVLVTSDVVMNPGSIEIMVDEIESDPTIGIIGPKLLFPETSTDPGRPAGKLQHAGLEMGINTNIYHVFNGWSADTPKANIRREPLALTGAMLVIRRDSWNRVGGFALIFGRGTYEDIDLCFSIRAIGQKVIYEPKACGYHWVGMTAQETKQGFDLRENEMIFKMRWKNALVWSDFNVL